MTMLRRQGIYSKSLPTIKSKKVSAAAFNIGGIVGHFERKFAKAFLVNTLTEKQEIFGDNISPSWYGSDAVKGFFDNTVPVSGQLYIKSHVGHTGTAIDAVVASAMINDTNPSPDTTLKISAAYQTEPEYGVSGNRTGIQIVEGYRFSTALNGATQSTDAFVTLNSVAGIKVGDLVCVEHTTKIYVKVLTIDEGAKKITFSGTVGAVVADAVVVGVCGFQVKTFRKSLTGIESEVATDLGKIWCTLEPEVSQFYVNNVHSTNPFINVADQSSESLLFLAWPASITTTQYLTGGADGTAATTAAHWAADLSAMDNLPVRFIANCESTVKAIQDAIETYCKAREDMPKAIFNIAEDRTKAQLTTIGQSFQRSDDVLGIIPANWLTISDPFANSSLSPDRHVPNVGHIMGMWIRSIGVQGIHYVPATFNMPINGITGVVGDQILDEGDRTDLCNAGINVIQNVKGSGYVMRSAYTPSTADEFKFANGIVMREFVKISALDSLTDTQNEPNNFDRIKSSADAVKGFMYSLWTKGSTGTVPTGETFGQSLADDNVTPTVFDDHVVIQADVYNNPQAKINLGERNIWIWFTYPTPAGSIEIGVGLMLR